MAKRPINYTSRDFESIRNDLVNYTKRYYPSTFKDFTEASFGSMMLDLVAYVGDQLSFYADFQANESFLDSAIRYENVSRLAETLGYRYEPSANSTGLVAFYVLVPANTSTRGPNLSYFPILQRGSIISSDTNASYTLIEDVDFTNANNEVTVARVDSSTGNPTFFAIKAYGEVISGRRYIDNITVGDYVRFLQVKLSRPNVTDILSVRDAQGNEYYQVDYLSQDVVMQEIKNVSSDRIDTPYTMRLRPVPRRFIVNHNVFRETTLQFGYGSADNLTGDVIADPADVVLKMNGRDYITDETFDPTNLIQTDKFGVVPTDTVLTIEYTANDSDTVNASVGSLRNVISPLFRFQDQASLDSSLVATVVSSIEADNEFPILGDTSVIMPDEIRERAAGTYAAQNRAVTKQDYTSLVYRMPSKFGKVKRCNVVQDRDSMKRNLNVYLLSENSDGDLTQPNLSLKNNVKVWLNQYRMINDSLDILNGKVINIGINFRIVAALDVNRYEVLERCVSKLQAEYTNTKFNIGDAVYISEIYRLLNEVPGVVDTTDVELVNFTGGIYSNYAYDIDSNLSNDGRYLLIPENAAAEVLVPGTDIVGVVT